MDNLAAILVSLVYCLIYVTECQGSSRGPAGVEVMLGPGTSRQQLYRLLQACRGEEASITELLIKLKRVKRNFDFYDPGARATSTTSKPSTTTSPPPTDPPATAKPTAGAPTTTKAEDSNTSNGKFWSWVKKPKFQFPKIKSPF